MKLANPVARRKIEIIDQPMPWPEPGEVLIKVLAVGFSGTDLSTFRTFDPGVPSLQFFSGQPVGEIVELGEEVPGLQVGDRVVVDMSYCGSCVNCSNGYPNFCLNTSPMVYATGFAEYVKLRPGPSAWRLPLIPAGVSMEEAAFSRMLSTALHAVRHAARPGPEDTVVVLSLGTMGQAMALLVGLHGAEKVIGIDPVGHKLEAARHSGVTHPLQTSAQEAVQAVKDLTGGRGASIVYDCLAVPATLRAALEMVRIGGSVVILGVPRQEVTLPLEPLVFRSECRITAAKGPYPAFTTEGDFLPLKLLADGRIRMRHLLTHSYGLEEIQQAFLDLEGNVSIRPTIFPHGR